MPARYCVLGRSRTEAGRHSLRSHPRFGQHATLPASLYRLAYDALTAWLDFALSPATGTASVGPAGRGSMLWRGGGSAALSR